MNIKDFRKNNKLTQEELAKILEIKRQQLQRYETGINEMPMKYYIKMATHFGVTVDYLLGLSDK